MSKATPTTASKGGQAPHVIAGRYEVVRGLGRGGMGEVLLARDLVLHREVALKQLHGELAANAAFTDRFAREAQAIARIRHPGVIQVYDFLPAIDGRTYLVLEYVPGWSLADEVGRRPMPWGRCATIGAAVCDALQAAHEAGVIHRDIKPSNILIEPSGAVRVADFGVARLLDASATHTGTMLGTPMYMAPEVGRGRKAGPTSDLYGLAAVLFEAACGRPPFISEDADSHAVLYMHIVETVPDPADFVPDLPDAAREILLRCLAKDPEDRFSSAAEMAAALRRSAVGADSESLAPLPPLAVENRRGDGDHQPVERGPGGTELASPGRAVPTTQPPVPGTVAATRPATPAGGTDGDVAPPPTHPPMPGTVAATRPATPGAGVAPLEDPIAAPSSAAAPPDADVRVPDQPAGRAPIRARRLVAVLLGGAVLSAAVGAGIGALTREGAPEPVVVELRQVRAGGVSLQVPADWTATGARRPETAGVGFGASAKAYLAPGGAAGLAVGITSATGALLLEPAFVAGVDGKLSDPSVATLSGRLRALHYGDGRRTEPAGTRVMVDVVPTAAGAVTVVCFAPDGAFAAHAERCSRLLSTLRITKTTVFPVGPDPGYARFLDGSLSRFSTARTAGLSTISTAGTRSTQGDGAAAAATAYETLRVALTGREVSPQVADLHARLVRAAAVGKRAYGELSSAARAGSSTGWRSSRNAARTADKALNDSVRALSAAGYPAKAP